MKMLKIRIILFVFVTGILSGCHPRQAVLNFKSYASGTKEAQLKINGLTLNVPYDSIQGAVFTIKNFSPGYAFLTMGSIKKMVFLKPGDNLKIQYNRPNSSGSRYQFEGEGAAENIFLENHTQQTINLPSNVTEQEALQVILDSISNTCQELNSTTLSKSFKVIEQERLHYMGLNRIFNYRFWTKELVPFLEKQMKEIPELAQTSDYQNFMNNALYFVTWYKTDQHEHFHVAQSQMNYIDTCFQQTEVVDFLMDKVMSNYMLRRGAEQITPMMDVFTRRVTSCEISEKIKKEYEKWRQVLKGTTIPEFTFLDIQGNEVSLQEFFGKYVYIDCWATWCGPCQAQIPHLKKLEHRYAGKDIVFVSISSDSNREKWKRTIQDKELKGIQLIEKCPTRSEFSEHFNITGIPRFIILDKEGRIYDANAPRPSEPLITNLLDELLK